jgi:Zn-dependent protease with chaperone function
LRDVVEEMAVASGLAVPEIYVLDRERSINAFAAGHTRDDVAIGVTFGALKLLNRDELQGIIAHEFSHVLNGDTRLNLRLMALAHGLFWPTIVGRILVRGTTRAPEIGESIFDEGTHPVFLPTAPIGFLFLVVGAISAPLVRLLKSLICREREWLADAAAVQFTRNPAGITGAFKKIGGLFKQGRLDTPHAETASHLYFVNSVYDPWFSVFSTHPLLVKRMVAIDPAFDGQFPQIKSLPRPVEDTSQEVKYDHLYEETVRRAREEAKTRGEIE